MNAGDWLAQFEAAPDDRWVDAERSYVCCLLHHGTSDIVRALPPDAFADPTCRQVVEVAQQLADSGDAVDLTAVALAKQAVTWPAKVAAVYDHPGAIYTNWKTYRRLVEEGALRRRSGIAAERIRQAAEQSDLATLRRHLAAAARLATEAGTP